MLAPSNSHLRLKRNQIVLDPVTCQHHMRSAIDTFMKAIVESHQSVVIGVFLTGTGSDCIEGARCIKAVGGKVIAEHETTSVVCDMPCSIVETGLADGVIPLPNIAPSLLKLIERGKVQGAVLFYAAFTLRLDGVY